MKNLQAKLKEIFEPMRVKTRTEVKEITETKGFEIRVFEDGRGNYFILDAETSELWRTVNFETMIEFVSEKLGGGSHLNF